MPFDGTDYRPPGGPRHHAVSDTAAVVIIVGAAFVLLAMPISMAATIDLVQYLRGH
jgi:hypothetical protein